LQILVSEYWICICEYAVVGDVNLNCINFMCCSVGHRGKFGHEFMEFELFGDGKLRYANNSNYKNDSMIRKEGNIISNSCPCNI
jgi:hypothetical protein